MKLENMYEIRDIKILINRKEIKYIFIKYFELKERINKHNRLEIKFEVDKNVKNEIEKEIENNNVEIKIELSKNRDADVKIFNGIIEFFEILNYGHKGCRISICAFSKSILMDRRKEKKYRVFQDENITFQQIIEEVNKEYTEKKVEVKVSETGKRKIGGLIIQYDETDWEFLVRISSHLNSCLLITGGDIITFGVIENINAKEENKYFSDYSLLKEEENLYYKIYSNSVLSLGDNVSINNKENSKKYFTVLKTRIYADNNILKSETLITDIRKYKIYKKYNEKIRGSKIEAKVERVFEENEIAKMEVRFSEGLDKIVKNKVEENNNKSYEDYGVKRFPLSYQTFYSQTNTGFFCTPEVNDNVEVYFSTEDENSAKVSWAVNNRGNGRFSNYEKRNFHINGNDFNFLLEKDIFTMNIGKSFTRNSKDSMETAENLVNKGNKNLLIVSDDYLGIESIDETSIYGKSIDIIGKEKDIRIETPKEIRMKGKKVHSN